MMTFGEEPNANGFDYDDHCAFVFGLGLRGGEITTHLF